MRQQLVSVRLGALAFSCRVMSNQRGAGEVCWVGKALEGWGLGGSTLGCRWGRQMDGEGMMRCSGLCETHGDKSEKLGSCDRQRTRKIPLADVTVCPG